MANGEQAWGRELKERFKTEGYAIVSGLFSSVQIADMEQTFADMSNRTIPGYFEPDLSGTQADPLKRYPRVMHPHRFNETAKSYMLHEPVLDVLRDLFGEEPLAAQSMFYYKPPGSRGQALHQDNFYLKVRPGNCIAAWTAVDPADEENGCMLVVPRTNGFDIVCPEKADESESFTVHFVRPPKDRKAVPAIMKKGDVLFFNGNLIHGSYRNKSQDRFRRAFICHYVNGSTEEIASYYRPLYRADGTEVTLNASTDGGPCGVESDSNYPH